MDHEIIIGVFVHYCSNQSHELHSRLFLKDVLKENANIKSKQHISFEHKDCEKQLQT